MTTPIKGAGFVRSAGINRVLRLVCLSAGLVGAATATAAVDFAPRVNVKVAAAANALAIGELTGDGVRDLVVANGAGGTVHVVRGLGAGGFAAGGAVATGAGPTGVVIADFNGDGKGDVATADSGANTVSVLLGDGAGGLGPANPVTVGQIPATLTAGDVNGDGRIDLAVANLESLNVSLLLGAGDGTFTVAPINVGVLAVDAVFGDVTGDGVTDLVAGNGSIRVLPGPWSGTNFGLPFELGVGPFFPTRLAVADLNGDGRPDLVGANAFSNDVNVYLGLGGNAFRRLAPRPASNVPSALAVADVNADGYADVATANTLSGDVSVLEGAASGVLRAAKQFRVGVNPSGVVAGDVTGDGRDDLAVANLSGTVSILIARPLAAGTTGSAKVRVPCDAPKRLVLARSIGCVAVGMSRAQVVEILGPPTRVRRAGRDYAYQYPKMLVGFLGEANAVDLVASERPGVGLASGLRVGTPGSRIKRLLPRAVCAIRNGVRFCTHRKGEQFTGFVDKGGLITEVSVGLVE